LRRVWLAGFALAALQLLGCLDSAACADTVLCSSGAMPGQAIRLGGPPNEPSQPDLLVTGPCRVPPGTYYYGNVNIVGDGSVTFEELPYSTTHFWASAIIVESGAALMAGSAAAPFGALGGAITIHLYGADQSEGQPDQIPGQGALCRTRIDPGRDSGPCGVPLSVWTNRDAAKVTSLPGGVAAHFVPYDPLPGDGAAGPRGPGYFGYKVLGISYGGALALFGAKGVDRGAADSADDLTAPGLGWVNLAEGSEPDRGATQLSLDRSVQGNWTPGDEVVLTPTDGHPEHAEALTVDSVRGATITFHRTACGADGEDADCPGLQWPHQAVSIAADASFGDAQPRPPTEAASAAAVALLTRSIAIVGAGDAPGQSFEAAAALKPGYSFGGHTIARQGFRAWQVQGVAFYRLGQDSRRDHDPINFHLSGPMPPDSFVKDSIVQDTMTRWYQPHAIMGIALQRLARYRAIDRNYLTECTYFAGYAFCQQ
jgi:hypothetical protein